jgi:phosphatidylglycerol:prolipoprotein diacylglycerol transferase
MFPTLADIINYLFHTNAVFPVQTLGFFMALAFILSYQVFKSEFKRKESDGLIHPIKQHIIIGNPASVTEITVNGLLGFLFGFKILGALVDYKLFLHDPKTFFLSNHGNLITGIICCSGFAYWAYTDKERARLPEPVVIEKIVHPWQLMLKIVFLVAFWGFIGAKLFDTVEHLNSLRYDPFGTLFSVNGFTYYGGLIFGALAYLYFGHRHGMKLVHLADMGSPGMMLAYAIGRIGCQLSGDGDWGIVNLSHKPPELNWVPGWMWSFKFPHNEINAGLPMPGCSGSFCHQLANGVYQAGICSLLFIFMWIIRKHIHTAGLMFYLYLVLNGGERLLIETIRVNIKYRVLGINFTQAELIGGCMLTGGIIGIVHILYRQIKKSRIFEVPL